jgi:hypothetical protein
MVKWLVLMTMGSIGQLIPCPASLWKCLIGHDVVPNRTRMAWNNALPLVLLVVVVLVLVVDDQDTLAAAVAIMPTWLIRR